MLSPSERAVLRHWYETELQPRLSKLPAREIVQGAAMGRTYAYAIIACWHPHSAPSPLSKPRRAGRHQVAREVSRSVV